MPYLAWQVDSMIHGCLGFEITRQYPNKEYPDTVLPAWVSFKGQSNPDWIPQTTSIWPIQKLSWRDLTLIRRRDSIGTHTQTVVQYLIRPVGPFDGNAENSVPSQPSDNYKGTPIPLSYIGDGYQTNQVTITNQFGNIWATFTNGIMATQWLSHTLQSKYPGLQMKDAKAKFIENIQTPGNDIRSYMTGEVLNTLKMLLEQAANTDGATIKMAIYELNDPELIDAIINIKDKVENYSFQYFGRQQQTVGRRECARPNQTKQCRCEKI